MNLIPCTIAILTHDNAATLPCALESVKEFAEIIICDGGSTDDTVTIARAHGARVIPQNQAFLDATGHIVDFAGVRNQTLAAATQPWFFFLDSDEYMSAELAEEIRRATGIGETGAYWIFRKYVVDGEVVECATTYPNRSMRFFALASVQEFIKPVHERIKLNEGIVAKDLRGAALLVPILLDIKASRAKSARYIAIEAARRANSSYAALIHGTFRDIGISGLFLLRLARIWLFCRGKRLPLWNELARHDYHAKMIAAIWRARLRRQFHAR